MTALVSPDSAYLARSKVCCCIHSMERQSLCKVAKPCLRARMSRKGSVPSSILSNTTQLGKEASQGSEYPKGNGRGKLGWEVKGRCTQGQEVVV